MPGCRRCVEVEIAGALASSLASSDQRGWPPIFLPGVVVDDLHSASPTFPIATTNLSHKHSEPLFAPYHACVRSVLETAPMPSLPLQDTVHETAPFDWKTLRVERDGETVVVPCLSFTLWFGVTDAPLLLDFYERAMEALGTLFTHYIAESMKARAKITPRALTMIPTWIRKPAEFKIYYAQFSGGPDTHPASFDIVFRHTPRLTPARQEAYRRNLPTLVKQGFTVETGLPATVFRVTLPLDHPLAAPAKLIPWVLEFEAVKRGEFICGGCDLAINYDAAQGDVVEKEAWALCGRYPGLDWFTYTFGLWLRRYEPGIGDLLMLVKRAGWITLVNQKSIDYLGGQARLEEVLAHDRTVAITRVAHGAVIRCGETPRLGELARADIPYRSVAGALRPVRLGRVLGMSKAREEWIENWLGLLDAPVPGEAQ